MDRALYPPRPNVGDPGAGQPPPMRARSSVALTRVTARHQGTLLATAHICLALSRRANVSSFDVARVNAERIADAIRDLLQEVSPL